METLAMPHIDITEFDSPNCSKRNAIITHVVLHHTDGSLQGSIAWHCNPVSQVSAHLMIGRDGKVACVVNLSDKAWHAGNGRINGCSIGIEIVASNSLRGMTVGQEEVLIKWLKWIQARYKVPTKNIIPHRWIVATDCPGLVFPTDEEFEAWRSKL